MAVAEETVVFAREGEALLQYPDSLRVRLAEKSFGKPAVPPKKAKRTKRFLNEGEQLQNEYHTEVRGRLLYSYTRIMEAAKSSNYFPVQHLTTTNSGSSVDFTAMCNLALLTEFEDTPVLLQCDPEKQENIDIFGRVVTNICDQTRNITVLGRQFLIPSKSTFLLSDLCQVCQLYNYAAIEGKYDLIVIDPPWENRSAIRGRKYDWLPSERLLELSISDLATTGAVVAIWVTNKRKYARFIQRTLFPKWGVTYLAEWHWLKVTTSGDLIHEMDSTHKKPYEGLILGRYMEMNECDEAPPPKLICLEGFGDGDGPSRKSGILRKEPFAEPAQKVCSCVAENCCNKDGAPCVCITDCTETGKKEECVYPPIPEEFVFVCVASQEHSQKPYLGDVLKKYCNEPSRKLELFARNLLPDWTSWGNEVLKFQERTCSRKE